MAAPRFQRPGAIDSSSAVRWMGEALFEAELAAEKGEVPVGAVVVIDDSPIARAHNLVETLCDPTAHAEVLAIRQATRIFGDWRLKDASLFVTLEPCPMCCGAILLSRFKEVYFGAYDPIQGAMGSVFDISNHPELPHSTEVYPELEKDKSSWLLRKFFSAQRHKRGSNRLSKITIPR